ncbi:MAG: hypothetical protein ABSG35_14775 [Syntrophobacteraceae bacterium]
MPFPEAATLFSRCAEAGPPQGTPELPGPVEYGSSLLIVKVMNRIMAEHFGIPPRQQKRLTRAEVMRRMGDGFVPAVPAQPRVEIPAGDPGSQAPERSRRHE